METRKDILKGITIFLLITFALSSIFYLLRNSFGNQALYITGLMWCPGISALITISLLRRSMIELGWKWGETKYQLLGYIVPFAYTLVAYVIVWISGLGGFYNEEFVSSIANRLGWHNLSPGITIVLYSILRGVFGLPQYFATALGEEIGWRGFLVPQLARLTSFSKTALISGIIWAIWHYPLFSLSDDDGILGWLGLICFTLMVVGISFIFAWLRLKSGSLWPAVVLHASHNLFIQSIFTPLTKDTGITDYFIDETGFALAIMALLTAYIFWRKSSQFTIIQF